MLGLILRCKNCDFTEPYSGNRICVCGGELTIQTGLKADEDYREEVRRYAARGYCSIKGLGAGSRETVPKSREGVSRDHGNVLPAPGSERQDQGEESATGEGQ